MSGIETLNIGMTQGPVVDGFPETIGLSDTNNVIVSPMRDCMEGRNGYAIYKEYSPVQPGSPVLDDAGNVVDQIVYVVETRPANMNDGTWMVLGSDLGNNKAVVPMELFKPRSNLPGDTTESQIFFSPETYDANYGDTVTVTVKRVGAFDRTVTVQYNTRNESAISGTDYNAASGTLTFAEGETTKTISVVTIGGIHVDSRSLSLVLHHPSTGAAITGANPATINLAGVNYGFVFKEKIGNDMKAIMFDPINETLNLHTLLGVGAGDGYLFRVGPDTVMAMAVDTLNVTMSLYSIATLIADGTGTSTARYAYATFAAADADELSLLRILPCDSSKFYAVTGSSIMEISLSDATMNSVVFPDAPDTVRPYQYAAWGAIFPHLGLGYDTSGNIVFSYKDSTPDLEKVVICRVNPTTGALVASNVFDGNQEFYGGLDTGIVRSDGTVVCWDESASQLVVLSADLQTVTLVQGLAIWPFKQFACDTSGRLLVLDYSGTYLYRRATISGGTVTFDDGAPTIYSDLAKCGPPVLISDYEVAAVGAEIVTDMFGDHEYAKFRKVETGSGVTLLELVPAGLSSYFAEVQTNMEDPFYFNARYIWGTA